MRNVVDFTPPSRQPSTLNWALAACLVLSAAFYWRFWARFFEARSSPDLIAMTTPLVILWIGSIEGLLRGSRRGYFFVYGLVPFATIFFGLVLIPGGRVFLSLLDVSTRPWVLTVLNLVVLAAAIAGHVRSAKSQSRARAA